MKTLFLDAPFEKEVKLCQETLEYLKKYKKVGLYASVQFCNQLKKVKEQLTELGIEIVTSKAKRTNVASQLLGCDNYHNSLNVDFSEFDVFLYVGDGKFHPLALVYAQKDCKEWKEIICNDPIANTFNLLDYNHIKTILRKYRGSLKKFFAAENVGVIVTIKPGQEHLRVSYGLEKKYPNKKFYYFIDNNVSFDQLENFNFIDVWVNTACPRVGFDDQEKFRKGVINLNDAFNAEENLSKDSLLNSL